MTDLARLTVAADAREGFFAVPKVVE